MTSKTLQGQAVVVLGGTAGIGQAVARRSRRGRPRDGAGPLGQGG